MTAVGTPVHCKASRGGSNHANFNFVATAEISSILYSKAKAITRFIKPSGSRIKGGKLWLELLLDVLTHGGLLGLALAVLALLTRLSIRAISQFAARSADPSD